MTVKHGIIISPESVREADRLLLAIEEHARGAAIGRVLRAAGEAVKKAVQDVLPKPGYPGDKPDLKPLRDTVSVKVKNYQGGFYKVLIVGYALPAGAHGHLVEFGHEMTANTWWNGERLVSVRSTQETGVRVEGKFYFSTAVKLVQPRVDEIILTQARREAERVRPQAAAA
jgi:hypothetical protein